jgi:anti-sigma regulatory factor (Ser/Thr protein kinase)/CheY-like chemotaxis protein
MRPSYRVCLVGSVPEIPEVFEDLPCEVTLAEHLDALLAAIAARKPDLVLCDYPNLAPIRDADPQLPVIVLAAEAPHDKVLAAMELAYAYFSPPFDPAQIREMVIEALENPDVADGIKVDSRDPKFTTLRLRCRVSTADRLIRFVLQMKSDLSPEDRIEAAMAFREMLLNAIEHGGKLNPNAWVRVTRVRTQRTVVYYIQDPGAGFSRGHLPHAAIENPEGSPAEHLKIRAEQGMRAGGFGMMMTQQLVDEVIYNEQGNEVVLIKHFDRPPLTPPAPATGS